MVIDSYFGLFRLNATTGHKKPLGLQPTDKNLPDEWRGLFNDYVADPTNENIVYVSVSSTRWTLEKVPWSLAEHENSGIVLALDLKTGKVTKLIDNFYFTNGIELSADGKFLLVSECSDYRITKISLEEIRKAISSSNTASLKKEVFAENLPGEPDNIRLHDGNILVGFAITRVGGPTLGDRAAGVPFLRKAVSRMVYLTYLAVDFVWANLWPHHALEEIVFKLKSGHVFYGSLPTNSAIGVLDGNTGEIKALLGSNRYNAISEAIVDGKTGDLFFGSFKNKFIGRLSAKEFKAALE